MARHVSGKACGNMGGALPLGRFQWGKSRTAKCCSALPSDLAVTACPGDTLVVDGAAWMWKQPPVPRKAVSRASRGVEAKSRSITTGQHLRSKL